MSIENNRIVKPEESNRKKLNNIIRLLKRATKAKRFSLTFANCSSITDQNKYVHELQERCLAENIVIETIELWNKLPIDNLFEEIHNYLQQKYQDNWPENLSIQVSGLEVSILLDSDEFFPTVLQTLNIGRERYYLELPYPLLIWLPGYAYVKLANVAPDFWSVREGSFTFYSEERIDEPYNIDEMISEKKDINVWREKIAQIPLLERLAEQIKPSEYRESEVQQIQIISIKNLIDIYIKLGDAYRFIGKIDKGKLYFEKAISYLNEHNISDNDRDGKALYGLGLIYTELKSFPEAVESFEKYIEIRKKQDKKDALAIGYNMLGFVYYNQGDFNKSISFYQQSLNINKYFAGVAQRQVECNVMGNLGLLYRKAGNFSKAIESHQKALNISREIENSQSELNDLSHIGSVYQSQKNYSEATSYYLQALELSRQIGNKRDELDLLINLGQVYLEQNDFQQSKDYYIKALSTAEEVANEKLVIDIQKMLIDLYEPNKLDDINQQIYWVDKLIEETEKSENLNNSLNSCKILIGICNYEYLGRYKQEWLLKAESLLQKLSQQKKLPFSPITYYKMLVFIYKGLGHDKEVKEYEKILEKLRESSQVNIWLPPDVANVKQDSLVLSTQKAYQFYLKIGLPETEHSWIFTRKFDPENINSKSLMQQPREAFKYSTEEGEKNTKSNLVKNNTNMINPENGFIPSLGKTNSQRNHNLKNIIENLKNTIFFPVHTPEMENLKPSSVDVYSSDIIVEFTFQGQNVKFDEAKKILKLPEITGLDQVPSSETVILNITPLHTGYHKIQVNISVNSSDFQDQFEFLIIVEEGNSVAGSITLTDEKGRTLECYIEHSLSVDGQEYVLLLPVDSPIEIFAWQSENEEEEAVLVEDDTIIQKIFSTAQAVLSEQNLKLKNTAYALTVAGDLPPVEESELFTLEFEDEETKLEPEQLQLLASFYDEDQEYAIYTPLDPLLFFARISKTGQPELLSPEEFRKVQPLLEEQLFKEDE